MFICSRCASEFEPTASNIRYKQYICKPCRNRRDKDNLKGNPMALVLLRARKRAYQRELLKNPVEHAKQLARIAVRVAIDKGQLTRRPCVVCGDTPAEAHHEDYSKPLDVVWLCITHHGQLHS